MTRIEWGASGERFYEVGIDRGVLYVPGYDGVPWQGLSAIKENPAGAEPQPYYQDGIKYLNVASSEEFQATLEAFSSPSVFDVCDGVVSPYSGLQLTEQPRKKFGLSYRTRVGNDVDGLDHAYKIHLVYNALAGPSSKEHVSLSNNADPLVLSWGITTVPERLSGVKPTAHLIIDSRNTNPALLLEIEDQLYGNDIFDPVLPTASEILAMFAAV